VRKAEFAKGRAGGVDDLGKVEQRSLQCGMSRKNAGEQGTIAAAYVDHAMKSREVKHFATAVAICEVKSPIAASKLAASSGCCAKYANESWPKTRRNAGSPVLTL